jgi:anti-sigma regulatory factor (Ser/Thr protein kinase)/anti-anti-sigma regulatory factor
VQLHDLTLTLQGALLPEGLPVLPGLQTAGSYLLAEDEIAAGGDWLDVLPLGRGHVAFVVGDVVGHGVEASAVMGQLRAICEERLTSGAGVTGTMAALDRYAARQNGARSATITLMDLDTATGELTYCTAGHPPPLVLHEYESRFLAPTGGGPLGTGSSFPVATNRLGDKEVLLLYTDGIIERPYRQPARATVELAQVAGRALRGEIFDDEQPAVDRICRQTVELLTRESGYTDDITMLAVQRRPRLPALTFELEAVPSVLGEVRARLNAWFSLLDPSPLDQMAIQHAVGELVTNVVEHAYSEDARYRPVCVSLELDEQGMAVAKVEDHGRWRSDSGSQGHRGLPMVNGLMDEVSVERRGDQTTVIVRHRLTRGITLLKGVSTSAPDVALSAYATAYDDDNVLSVAGVVDLASAEHLRRDLNALTTAGHDQATVDLSQVELLASAGVQVLFEARGQAARQGVDVQFRATRGSVAQHVLELVNLPVVTHGGDPGWADELPPL